MEEITEVTNEDLLNALTELNKSSSATNKSVQELQAYFIAKDKKEAQEAETQKKIEEQEGKEQAELEEQQKRESESAEAEQTAKADAQTETYTELLTEINEGIQLNNQIVAVQGIYFGIVIGLLFIKIFVDRLTKK